RDRLHRPAPRRETVRGTRAWRGERRADRASENHASRWAAAALRFPRFVFAGADRLARRGGTGAARAEAGAGTHVAGVLALPAGWGDSGSSGAFAHLGAVPARCAGAVEDR